MTSTWTMHSLRAELDRFERELIAAGKSDKTIATYVDRAERFLRFLEGEYRP